MEEPIKQESITSRVDEARLLQLLAEGSELAFLQIYHKHKNRVFSTALEFLKSREDAKEILQETFVKVWTRREEFSRVRSAEAYIYTIARNLTINALTKKNSVRNVQGKYALGRDESADTTNHVILDKENERLLSESLALLSPQQQKIFLLSRVDGLSNDDIAKKLKLSRNTVKHHIRESLHRIREHLKPHIGGAILIAILFFQFS